MRRRWCTGALAARGRLTHSATRQVGLGGRRLERDVGVGATFAGIGVPNRGGQRRPGGVGGNDLVDDSDLNRLFYATSDALMFGGQLRLELGAYIIGNLGQLAPVQDPYGGNWSHYRDLSTWPCEDPGSSERASIHGDIRAAVRLPSHQGDPRHHRFAEGMEQLGPPTYHAVPFLPDTGQIAGYVDDNDQRHPERVAHSDEPGSLLRAERIEAASEAQRVVGDHSDRASAEPPQRNGDVRSPPGVQLHCGAFVQQAIDQWMNVIGTLRR